MTHQEILQHYANIVTVVFTAEHNLNPALIDDFKAGKITPRQYCLRIAEEIISKTPKEQLDKLYADD